MLTCVTDTLIEEIINATCTDTRSRHLVFHALHGLVRVAKVEQLQEMRRDVDRARGAIILREGCDTGSTEAT